MAGVIAVNWAALVAKTRITLHVSPPESGRFK